MSDKKAIPLEAAIEWWEMRGEVLTQLRNYLFSLNAMNYAAQVEVICDLIKKIDELEGGKPYEVSNTLAPVFARIFNSLVGEYFVVIESRKMKEARQ